MTFQQFIISLLVGFLLAYSGAVLGAWREDRKKRAVHYEFKAMYLAPTLNALQWVMFLSDKAEEGWEFIGISHEEMTRSNTFIILFRRPKLKGDR